MSDNATLKSMPDLSNPLVAEVLVENHKAFLKFLTKRLGSMADAEDVLQDFCIKVLSHQGQLRSQQSLVAWLYTLLRTTLIDHYRKTGRLGRAKQAYSEELKTETDTPDHDDLFESFCNCLHALLPALRNDQADLVKRIDLAGEDRAKIAKELGVTTNTLTVRLHRARQALRQALLASCTSCLEHGFDDCDCFSEDTTELSH